MDMFGNKKEKEKKKKKKRIGKEIGNVTKNI